MSTRRMVEVYVEISGCRYMVGTESEFHHSLIAEAARGGFQRVEEAKDSGLDSSEERPSLFSRLGRMTLKRGSQPAGEAQPTDASSGKKTLPRSPRRVLPKPSFSSLTNNVVLDRYGFVRPLRIFIKTENLTTRPNILGQVEVEDTMALILQVTSVPELELSQSDLVALREHLETVEYSPMALYMGYGDTLDVVNLIYTDFGISEHRITWRTGHCKMEIWLKDRKAAQEDPSTIEERTGEMRCEAICPETGENVIVDLRVRGSQVSVTVTLEDGDRASARRASKELDSHYPNDIHIFVSAAP